jgi:ubiquinone/menaquinone biosynthesis C-methylase UbiE
MKTRPNYGLDSPRIVATLFVLGAALCCLAYVLASGWRWISLGIGVYFLFGALGMLFYSKIGKRRMRERLLDRITWRGNERVLDVGCGRGLLAVAAAHRVPGGSVVGVDIWNPTALTGNRADSVFHNAEVEGVTNRVEAKQGDARQLPFADASFDVVVSNYVVHELKTREDRQRMMREVARVLKPGGRVALIDFIFTDDCIKDLASFGVDADRVRDGFFSFWISAILNFGAVKTYQVLGKKR